MQRWWSVQYCPEIQEIFDKARVEDVDGCQEHVFYATRSSVDDNWCNRKDPIDCTLVVSLKHAFKSRSEKTSIYVTQILRRWKVSKNSKDSKIYSIDRKQTFASFQKLQLVKWKFFWKFLGKSGTTYVLLDDKPSSVHSFRIFEIPNWEAWVDATVSINYSPFSNFEVLKSSYECTSLPLSRE